MKTVAYVKTADDYRCHFGELQVRWHDGTWHWSSYDEVTAAQVEGYWLAGHPAARALRDKFAARANTT